MLRFFCKILFLIAAITIFSIYYCNAQTVGLVLSGGGSKGLAHIGVIRALEENNIPIDYVAGTSIGAIIGSLYACGYTTNEMEEIIRSPEFKNWYKGKIPNEYHYYFKKPEQHADMINVQFAIRDSSIVPILPTNLVATQPMDLGIVELTAEYSAAAGYNFDSLMVPFRCVATDIYNNREVVFKKGDLGMAVRASMTFPFYFKPIMIDSVLLFDGGIVNNFPYDVMHKDFNPDIIIGSAVASSKKKPAEDDILQQIENMIMLEDSDYRIPDDLGVTISMKFGEVGLLDFHRLDEFTTIGYNSAQIMMDTIKQLIERRITTAEINARREVSKNKVPEFIIDNIYITGLNFNEKEYVKNAIKQNKKFLTIDQFTNAYYRLVADNQIESAMPRAVYNTETGFFDMYLNVKKNRRYNVAIGALISSGNNNQAYVGLEYKYLSRYSYIANANIYFGRLYSSFDLTGRIDFPFNYPLALTSSISINRWDYYRSSVLKFFEDVRPPYLIHYDNHIKFDWMTPINYSSNLILGGAYGRISDNYFQVNNFLQSDTADITDFTLGTAHLSVSKNSLNFKQYPNRGTFRQYGVRLYYGNEMNYPGSTSGANDTVSNYHMWLSVRFVNDSYIPMGKNFSLGTYFEIAASNKPLFNNFTSSILSAMAFTPTPQSKTLFLEDYRANAFAALGLKSVIRFTDRINLRLEGYAFLPYQKILKQDIGDRNFKAYYSEPFSYLYYSGVANLVYNTPLGPASLSVNYYKKDGAQFYFLFHIGYILFNNKVDEY
jgi:NTE family protein